MYMRGRRSRFIAVSATAVLALTGFSSGSEGGCASSGQDHDSSSTPGSSSSPSAGDADSSGTKTGAGSGSSTPVPPTPPSTPTSSPSADTDKPLKPAAAALVHCASMDDPYATVEVKNPNGREGLFTMKISFTDERGFTLVDHSEQLLMSAKETRTVRVALASTGRVDEIEHCEVDPRAHADR
ncbi:hypothetical protein B6E66_08275 [Streptomyces maremycinicus]|nr:hypothetical protein B6E66_08275 [Streptomyces sp. B9173]